MAQPTLSVCLITYNHAPYIAKAIESILAQQTDFQFELIIGDDCSTDGTSDIVKEYAAKYPERIQAIIHQQNVGGPGNLTSVFNAAKGKYLSYLEGDDYYLTTHRFQKQVDFLEQNPEFCGCFHDTQIIDETDSVTRPHYPFKTKDSPVSQQQLVALGNNSHTNSRVFRSKAFRPMPLWWKTFTSDLGMEILAADQGPWHYIDEVLSTYRIHATGYFSGAQNVTRTEFLRKSYEHLLTNETYRAKYGATIKSKLAHYNLEIARHYHKERKFGKYFSYLFQFVRYQRKNLQLVKFLIKQELMGKRITAEGSLFYKDAE